MVQLAGELFAQKGYRATTVREIADAAGILSGSLYHHFDSKESIGDEILSGFINDVLADYRAAVSSGGSPRDVLEQIVRSTSRTLARHRAALAMLQNDWNYFSTQPRFGYLRQALAEIERTWVRRSSSAARPTAPSARTWTPGSPTGCSVTCCGSRRSGASQAATAPNRWPRACCSCSSTASRPSPARP